MELLSVLKGKSLIAKQEVVKESELESTLTGSSGESFRTQITRAFLEQQGPLKSFISRFIRRPQDIDDIAQETFVRAFRAEKKGEIQHPKAYIYRVARNLAFETLTKKTTQLTCYIEDSCDESLLQSEENVEDNMIVTERFERVKVAIAELPPQCQRVFIMHKVYGFKYREISQQLEISVSTVEKHIMSGLKKCRQSVKFQERPNSVIDLKTKQAESRERLKKQ